MLLLLRLLFCGCLFPFLSLDHKKRKKKSIIRRKEERKGEKRERLGSGRVGSMRKNLSSVNIFEMFFVLSFWFFSTHRATSFIFEEFCGTPPRFLTNHKYLDTLSFLFFFFVFFLLSFPYPPRRKRQKKIVGGIVF